MALIALLSLVACLRNHHAFAERESVGLDHDRQGELFAESQRIIAALERPRARGWDAKFAHQFFRQDFRRLETRRSFYRTENPQLFTHENIDDACSQRIIRTDHGEIDAIILRELRQLRKFLHANRNIFA